MKSQLKTLKDELRKEDKEMRRIIEVSMVSPDLWLYYDLKHHARRKAELEKKIAVIERRMRNEKIRHYKVHWSIGNHDYWVCGEC